MDDEYDEFGNYIGPPPTADDASVLSDQDTTNTITPTEPTLLQTLQPTASHSKDLFPSAESTYGPSVQVVVNFEDSMTLDEPVVKGTVKRRFTNRCDITEFCYSEEHLRNVLAVRHVSVSLLGAMHAGKTTVAQMLIEGAAGQTADDAFMDSHQLESARHITLFLKPVTVVLKSGCKSVAVTMIDTPGHLDYHREQQLAVHYTDTIMFCVDAVEGITMAVEQQLGLIDLKKRIILVLNKIDRLILECRLTPIDCYHKLKYIIDACNTVLNKPNHFDPTTGNVVFASATHRWMFTIDSFMSRMYNGCMKLPTEYLFGDIYSHKGEDNITNITVSNQQDGGKRTFVEYVLEPIYKLYTHSLTNPTHRLRGRKTKDCKWSMIVRRSVSNAIGWDCDFLFHNQSHLFHNQSHLFHNQSLSDPTDPSGDDNVLAVSFTAVMFEDQLGFLVKVVGGQLRVNDTLTVAATASDTQHSITLSRMFLYNGGRHLVPLKRATVGSIVFVPLMVFGDYTPTDPMFTLTPTNSIVTVGQIHSEFDKKRQKQVVSCKVGVEPLVPGDLPSMQLAIKRALLLFPSLVFVVEETGEHCLIGEGELYLDTILSILRSGQLIDKPIEFRVSDPSVAFCETVTDQSTVTCYADTPNGCATVCMLCEPVEPALVDALQSGLLAGRGKLEDQLAMARIGAILRDTFKWDVLAARSIMAVGPDPQFGTNLLLYDILDSNVVLDESQRLQCIQAFQWACRQGPLLEAPVRGVKFRLVDFRVNTQTVVTAGQLIPTVRRACFAAMVTATCRLVEPVLQMEVVCQLACREAVSAVVSKRRGHVHSDTPIPGTPWYALRAFIPAIDSFGAETDIRIACQGLCSVQSVMHHWQPVPGDPMADAKIPPLTAAPAPMMARDFINKTRRRKGLADNVKVERYLDERMMRALSSLNI